MADQAVFKSPTHYVSGNPERGYQRSRDTLRCVVSVPNEAAGKAIMGRSE